MNTRENKTTENKYKQYKKVTKGDMMVVLRTMYDAYLHITHV